MSKEKRYERKMQELDKIRDVVGDFIAKSLAQHTEHSFAVQPKSKEDLENRKTIFMNLHQFVENNYNRIYASGVFFNYVENTGDCSKQELLFYSKRDEFAETYRELYRLLHDYLNDSLNLLEAVYMLNGSYIWQLHEMRDNFDKRETNENKTVAYTNGVKHNVELSSFGLPKSSSIPVHNDYISIIQNKTIDAGDVLPPPIEAGASRSRCLTTPA